MTIESMLAYEPVAQVLRQASPNAVDAAGIPLHSLVSMFQCSGRLVAASANQRAAWGALAIEADYEFITLQGPDVSLDIGEVVRPKWPWTPNTASDQYPNLAVWYPMADPSNPSTIVDLISPSRNDATKTAGTNTVASDPTFNSVESFDQSTYYDSPNVGAGSDGNLSTTVSFSLSVWLNPRFLSSPPGGAGSVVSKGGIVTGNLDGWQLQYFYNNERCDFNFADRTNLGGLVNISTIDFSVPLNVWSHVVITVSDTAVHAYVNGLPSDQLFGFTPPGAPNYATYKLEVGNDVAYADQKFKGLLTDLRIYEGRAVTAAQVAALYSTTTRWDLMQQQGIINGDFLQVDGRLFRITGFRMKRMAAGNIPSYWKYACVESHN